LKLIFTEASSGRSARRAFPLAVIAIGFCSSAWGRLHASVSFITMVGPEISTELAVVII
jgi:hypothetical protein